MADADINTFRGDNTQLRKCETIPPPLKLQQPLISTILLHLKRSSIDFTLPTCAQPLSSNVDHFYSLPKIVSNYVRKRPPAWAEWLLSGGYRGVGK